MQLLLTSRLGSFTHTFHYAEWGQTELIPLISMVTSKFQEELLIIRESTQADLKTGERGLRAGNG